MEENKIYDLYVMAVRDRGEGIDSDVLEKAANPFYTSRNKRKAGNYCIADDW